MNESNLLNYKDIKKKIKYMKKIDILKNKNFFLNKIFDLKMKLYIGKLKNTSEIKKNKKIIAFINTILNFKKRRDNLN